MFVSRFEPLILVTFLSCYSNITTRCGYRSSRSRGGGSSVDVSSLVLYHRRMKEVGVGSGHADAPPSLSRGKGARNNTARQQSNRFCRLTEDSLSSAHYTLTTQSASMPVLVRSNTTSLLERARTSEPRGSNPEHQNHLKDLRTNRTEHRSSILEHRASTLEQRDHRTFTLDQREHRAATLYQRSKTMDRNHGAKDGHSKKLSM